MANRSVKLMIASAAAGAVTGTFGAGGGLVLIPLLCFFRCVDEENLFPTSVCIILSVSLVTLAITACKNGIPWSEAYPYLIGSVIGGIVSGLIGKRIPALWLHKSLGIMILYGGIRFLCRYYLQILLWIPVVIFMQSTSAYLMVFADVMGFLYYMSKSGNRKRRKFLQMAFLFFSFAQI